MATKNANGEIFVLLATNPLFWVALAVVAVILFVGGWLSLTLIGFDRLIAYFIIIIAVKAGAEAAIKGTATKQSIIILVGLLIIAAGIIFFPDFKDWMGTLTIKSVAGWV